jgi:hypothetical protein
MRVAPIAIALFLLIGAGGFFWYIGLKNTEQRQRNAVTAQTQAAQVNFDAMWKIIKEQAGVADQHKDAFKEIFIGQAEARYSKDENLMFKLITEDNPAFTPELYAKLMTSIEANRKAFEFEQKKLISMNQVHTDFVTTFPGSILGKEVIEIKYKFHEIDDVYNQYIKTLERNLKLNQLI